MNMCPSYKRKLPPESCLKGQVFYIWSSPHTHQIASEKIPVLGGRIENFLSKHITSILVESTYTVAAQQFCNELTLRAAGYAPNAIVGSNYCHPGVLYNLPSTSRGYKFLAATNTASYENILVFARQWAIPVLELGSFLHSIEPFVKSITTLNHSAKKSQNISSLTGCFIKFECYTKKFRPCYKMFSSDPERLMPLRNANVLIKAENCNVILDKPTGPRQLHPNHMDLNRLPYRAQDSKPPVKDKKLPKVKPKEENNYCECCRTHFSDLKTHIKSVNHQKFVSNEKNYESVNNILKMLPSPQEFIQKHQNPEQASNLILFNGDMMHNKNTSLITDLPLPLNLHIKKSESPVPLSLHDKPPDEAVLPLNLHIKKDESPPPLNLHVNQNEDLKQESPALHIEPSPLGNDNSVKSEIDVVGIKPDSPPDDDIVDCKDLCLPEVTNELLLESCVEDPECALDKTNTTALAHLFITNLENCWMENIDNIPDMDDMVFDDNIFDFDDCKSKADENECLKQEEDFSPEMNSPAFVSGISTDLKTQPNVNSSVLINSSIDLKCTPIKMEDAVNSLEVFSPMCKPNAKYPKSLSPSNLGINESLINDKINLDKDFDAKSNASPFYIDKPNMDMSPSCSNPIPVKLSEQMFSSESSDDENENLISNALNMINSNSDNEMKTDKDHFENVISKSVLQHQEHKTISIPNLDQSCTSNIDDLKNSGHSPISDVEARNTIHSEASCRNSPALPCVTSPKDVTISNQNKEEIACSGNISVSCASYSEMISRSPTERIGVSNAISNTIISTCISDRNTKEMACTKNDRINVDSSTVGNKSPNERLSASTTISNGDLFTQSIGEIACVGKEEMPHDFSKVMNQNSKQIGASNAVSNPIVNVAQSNLNMKEIDSNAMPIDFSKVMNQNASVKKSTSYSSTDPVDVDMSDQSIKHMSFDDYDDDASLEELESMINRNALKKTSVATLSDLSNEKHTVSDANYLDMIRHIRHQLDNGRINNEITDSAFSNISSVSLSDEFNSPVRNVLPKIVMLGNSSADTPLVKNTEVCGNNSEKVSITHTETLNKDLSGNKACYPLPGFICNVQQTHTENFKPHFLKNAVQNFVNKGNTQPVSVNKRNSDGVRHRDSFCDYNKGKGSQSLEKMYCFSKRDGRSKKEALMVHSRAPYTKAQPFAGSPKIKIPHKKNSRKLGELPSLWSVSILPGKGLKLKFTCLQPQSSVTDESDKKGAQSVKH